MQKIPLDDNALSTTQTLVDWLINIHNASNMELGKNIITYDDIINKMTHQDNKWKTYFYILLILVILIVAIILYRKIYEK
jgi:hypothetical protein